MERDEGRPRPASGWRLPLRGHSGHTARGEYVELDRPRRLVFTWGWEKSGDEENPVPPGASTIEVELTPVGNGTSLRFVHRDLPSAEAAESHAHGWDHYLPRLEILAAGGDPGEDPWLTQEMQPNS
ncbi:MAG TPA: SRPBCC family protein [Gaiellaceae bacterium]